MKFFSCIAFFVMGCNPTLFAQLCTGSLGDPLINITFGFGANPGSAVDARQTDYNYSSKSCPGQNEYSITNLSFGCFDNSWFQLTGDHTPFDERGYYMLVNAESTGEKNIFVYTAENLCANTTYELATWIANVLRPGSCNKNGTDPNMKFTVETLTGTVLASYKSGDIIEDESAVWKQYGMLFKTPENVTSVVLKISNTAPPGCGNAFAIDDITLRACGPKVSAGIGAEALVDVNVCDGDKTTFVLSGNYSSGFTNPAFQWQFLGDNLQWQNIPGANARSFVRPVTTSGVYSYRMLIGESAGFSALPCRIASNVVVINVLPPPFVQATNYIYGCLGGDVSMLASGGVKFLWTGPNGYTSTSQMAVLPKVQYSDSGLYKVEATTDFGCKNADSTILKVYPNATAKASGSSFICYGASRVLEAGGGVKYRWEPAKGLSADTIASPVASPVENTLYKVTVTNQYGCTDTASVRINVWEKPEANAGPDLKTRIGLPVVLRGSAKGANVSWHWIEANGTASTQQLTPMFNPRQTTTYRFNVVSGNGCGISTDEMTVKVYEKVLIPNAFSPNGDGINDTWNIEPLYFFPESVTGVYNRYGQPVYRSRGYNTQWNGTSNGKPLPAGTYYYVIDLKVNKEPALTGSVTILR